MGRIVDAGIGIVGIAAAAYCGYESLQSYESVQQLRHQAASQPNHTVQIGGLTISAHESDAASGFSELVQFGKDQPRAIKDMLGARNNEVVTGVDSRLQTTETLFLGMLGVGTLGGVRMKKAIKA